MTKHLNIGLVGLIFAAAACTHAAHDTAPAVEAAASQVEVVETVAEKGDAVATGSFEGRSDHITLGAVSIHQVGDAYELVFAGDFSLDGAPDPTVGFGIDGAYDASTTLGALKQKTGAQSYTLPASFDPSAVNEVYVWCDKFDVPLGVANLQ